MKKQSEERKPDIIYRTYKLYIMAEFYADLDDEAYLLHS